MKKHYDTAVIGGGIIGCAISYELAKTQQNVVLFEAGEVGRKRQALPRECWALMRNVKTGMRF